MFEYHGWATIRVSEGDEPARLIERGAEFEALKQLREAVNRAHDEFGEFNVRRAGNDLIVLAVHGLRNHRYEPVIELFRWVAAELPESYGLLYVHDDEDHDRGSDFGNVFRVWRIAQGRVEEAADPFLSPSFPTVEAP